jgi:hypothetical protein
MPPKPCRTSAQPGTVIHPVIVALLACSMAIGVSGAARAASPNPAQNGKAPRYTLQCSVISYKHKTPKGTEDRFKLTITNRTEARFKRGTYVHWRSGLKVGQKPAYLGRVKLSADFYKGMSLNVELAGSIERCFAWVDR